jgi:diketogulonate reductase-like aldo/keto reductase
VRRFCAEHGILYQGFSLLTANPDVFRVRFVHEIAARRGMTLAQLVFRFALEVGMVALTGTTSRAHMEEDLRVWDFALDPEEAQAIETVLA